MKRTIHIMLLLLIFASATAQIKSSADPVYRIPYLKNDFTATPPGIISLQKDQSYQLYADQFGNYPAKADLSAMFRATWCSDGLVITGMSVDDTLQVSGIPEKSDAMEVLLSPFRGSEDVLKFTVLPSASEKPAKSEIIVSDHRLSGMIRGIPSSAKAFSQRTSNLTCYKLIIPLTCLGISASLNSTLAMQVNFNDADGTAIHNRLQWNAIGNIIDNSFAMNEIVLTSGYNIYPAGTSKCYVTDNKKINLVIFSESAATVRVTVNRREDPLYNTDSPVVLPVKLEFSKDELNPETDTLKVYLNNDLISVHDLFLSAREYKDTRPGTYERDFRLFEARDRKFKPEPGGVLFAGSSSIKMWHSLREWFPGVNIIQRGFGGSSAADALFYFDRLVLPYKPAAVYYYEGDNDISRGTPVDTIVAQIQSFITRVHASFPQTMVNIISPKPSYARYDLLSRYNELNGKLKALCERTEHTAFIDVASKMHDDNGVLRRDIFLSDSLHLNEKGYLIWREVIGKTLVNSGTAGNSN